MNLYKVILDSLYSLLPRQPDRSAVYSDALCAPEGDKNALLFRADTAFELGGSGKAAVESVVFGDPPQNRDEVLLYGKDLRELSDDTPFAHFTVIKLREDSDKDLRYEQLQTIAFSVFQLYPEGYHIRISPSAGREQVRVARSALEREHPLSFMNVGCSLIRLLKKHEDVESVNTVFITDQNSDYRALAELARKAKAITDTVQRTLMPDTLDCASCKMKPVCDEIEGMRELHFQKERERKRHGT